MDTLFNDTTLDSGNNSVYTVTTEMTLCRDRNGEIPTMIYNLFTCAMCYTYIFTEVNVSVDYGTFALVTGSNTPYPEGTRMLADPGNAQQVCGSLLYQSECWKWEACCRDAQDCCRAQISRGHTSKQANGHKMCPMTWDGYACWPDTPAGETPRTQCPAHVPLADSGQYAYKTCTENGTWFLSPHSLKEWTDYTDCSNLRHYQRIHNAALACNIITILLLLPAGIIFLYYRPLRQQHRIRLHLCLMLASFLTSVNMLIWELFIFKDRLEVDSATDTVANQNSIGCRILSSMIRYSELASFMWMFIEAFHLHRLLVYAFTVPKALIPYYVFGFGFPILPVCIYSAIRGTSLEFNQKCWINNTGEFEWIIYTPSLLALVANMCFMLRIVFIMVRQLEPHPNEPSNFRRAIKAVVVLVPLFGVQFLLFVYRPDLGSDFAQISELLSKISSSLQGAFIAIIFCYINKEVQGYLKTSCMRVLRHSVRQDLSFRSMTMTTQYASEAYRDRSFSEGGDCSHIPLRPIYKQNSPNDRSPSEAHEGLRNGNLHIIHENISEDILPNHIKSSLN